MFNAKTCGAIALAFTMLHVIGCTVPTGDAPNPSASEEASAASSEGARNDERPKADGIFGSPVLTASSGTISSVPFTGYNFTPGGEVFIEAFASNGTFLNSMLVTATVGTGCGTNHTMCNFGGGISGNMRVTCGEPATLWAEDESTGVFTSSSFSAECLK